MGITADGNVRDSSHQHRQVEPAHDWAPDVWAMMYQRLPSSNCVHFIWISTKKKKKKWVIVFPKSCDWNIMWWLTLSHLCCTVKYGNNVWASRSDLSGPLQQLQIYWSESFCEDVYALGGMNVWWAGQDSVQCIVVLCSFLVDWMFLQCIFFGDHLMPQGRGCERTGRSCSQLRLLLAVAGSHAFSGREAVLGKFTKGWWHPAWCPAGWVQM